MAVDVGGIQDEISRIIKSYGCLLKHIDESASENYTIERAFKDLKNIEFEDDFLGIKEYINKRLRETDFLKLGGEDSGEFSCYVKSLLIKCPATPVAVERNFFMLQNLVTKKKRPFLISVYFNIKSTVSYTICN